MTAASSRLRDLRRLRLWLALFFCALALPAGLLTLRAYDQLKWEALRQSQLAAEELVAGIDARLGELIRAADARPFTDFSFLTLAGDPAAGFVARSPLSVFPPEAEAVVPIPGLIGWFQVDDRGRLSTPLLPQDGTDIGRYGIPAEELPGRQALEERISGILDQNALVPRAVPAPIERQLADLDGNETAHPPSLATREEAYAVEIDAESARAPAAPVVADALVADAQRPLSAEPSLKPSAAMAPPASHPEAIQSQAAFDRLARSEGALHRSRRQVAGAIASVDELELDDAFSARQARDKATAATKSSVGADEAEQRVVGLSPRRTRKELAALPEPLFEQKADVRAGTAIVGADKTLSAPSRRGGAVVQHELAATGRESAQIGAPMPASEPGEDIADEALDIALGEESDGIRSGARSIPAPPEPSPIQTAAKGEGTRRIRTFESEIDLFRFSLLDSGHFVLFRNAWRDDARFIQGALIDRDAFMTAIIGDNFRRSAIVQEADLAVAWGVDLLAAYGGRGTGRGYSSSARIPRGTLLYRGRPQDPFGALGLIFSVTQLPTPPGAALIQWLAAALALVLCLGTWLLYRLGARQIALVGQQQAFVSAVSHELKTPLTSIRMYSEMLREGWVTETRRADYYRFIHDESERLSRLIANVLQLARMARNETRVDLRPVAVGELLDLARERIASSIDQAGFALDMPVPPTALATQQLNVDPDALVQILINLTDNAIKFSADAERRQIDIHCSPGAAGTLFIGVRDYGPGIPRGQRKHVFQLFYRLDNATTKAAKGTGIGLALVRQLTRAMGGDVDVIERQPGVEVRLRFPVFQRG
jgi:signal transduction histidine kinase